MTSKYHSIKTSLDGIKFASRKEARVYVQLKLLERGKVISGLTLQPRYKMIVDGKLICTYVGDFFFMEDGKPVCADSKGFRTKDYIIKRKLFLALYPYIEHREM